MLYFKKIKKTPRDFNYFTPVYQKSWYDLQLLRYSVWQTETSNYGSFFALLPPPPNNPENENFEKNEKWEIPYEVWGTVPEIRSEIDIFFCHFGVSLPFYLTIDHKKLKFRKHLKNTWRYYAMLFRMGTINEDHTINDSWDLRHNKQSFCHFGLFFALWTP